MRRLTVFFFFASRNSLFSSLSIYIGCSFNDNKTKRKKGKTSKQRISYAASTCPHPSLHIEEKGFGTLLLIAVSCLPSMGLLAANRIGPEGSSLSLSLSIVSSVHQSGAFSMGQISE